MKKLFTKLETDMTVSYRIMSSSHGSFVKTLNFKSANDTCIRFLLAPMSRWWRWEVHPAKMLAGIG